MLALFFLPLFFTFPFAVKDFLAEENGAAILMRLMAARCGIALSRFFAWREVASSVDGSLFLIAGFLGYVPAAFHSCSYFRYAIAAAASCALVAIILLALALVLPDFSGFSVFTRQRFDVYCYSSRMWAWCSRLPCGFVVPVTAKGKCLELISKPCVR